MTLLAEKETLCDRELNLCKRRKQCKRYLDNPVISWQAKGWVGDYFTQFGQECPYFLQMRKDLPHAKSSSETC